ncbi:glycosyl hydrolase family 8 [Lederbergia panacisoli]|uniref:glycosyl hydrolase family 8 n=1 Tax=Lederbergia panacisoli TaxID=1255251 RepID=UPI00214BA24B|nr:glycosyl hydrolase family 8 [Lederbergia panacisoli]MCR2821437.1 glycosyl hydrolase family 8 [Lederbergia panacisoli]
MHISKRFKSKVKRSLSIMLVFMLVAVNFLELLPSKASAQEVKDKTTIAEWTFPENPTNLGVFPANGGVYRNISLLQAVPDRDPTTYSWDSASSSIRYQGWHQEEGKDKYWLTTFNTKGFENITVSSTQQGRGSSGPKDFRVQMSLDGENWTNVTGDGTSLADLVMINGVPTHLENAPLPTTANDLEKVFVRWLVISDFNTSGGKIGDTGSSQLVSIKIQGDLLPTEPINETVAEWISGVSIIGDEPVKATGGMYKDEATVKAVGGPKYYAELESHIGWQNGAGSKYWLASVSTKGYENITLSSEQKSGNSGPKDFKVQVSSDNENWIDVKDANIASPTSFDSDAAKLKNVSLPNAANDQDNLFIRWIMTTNDVANPVSYPNGIGEYGAAHIRNIVINGDRINGFEFPKDTEAPSTPKNLSGVGVSDTTINLSWTASTDNYGIAGYDIYRDGEKIGNPKTTSYSDTGLTKDTSYSYYVVAVDTSGNESEKSNAVTVKTKAEPIGELETIAGWKFANEGQHGSILATDGAYKSASTFRAVGGPFFEYVGSDGTLSYWGWDGADFGSKYWLATIPTKGFKNISLSSQQNSSGSGPGHFKVQISQDGQAWSDVPNTTLKMTTSSFACPGDACKLNNAPVPEEANDQDVLYIRWVLTSGTSTSGSPTIGGSGSSRIKDIVVSGERISGAEIAVPTIDLHQVPVGGSDNVIADAPVTVNFNKPIALNDNGAEITITNKNNEALKGITVEAKDNSLTINHPKFVYGETYTVTVPKERVKGTDDTPLVRDVKWSFKVQESPYKPKLMNMTFNGDPKTSIAFAWYTDFMTDTVVEVVEASKVKDGKFPETGALVYEGTGEEIDTLMVANDRATKNKTKFISHKAIADKLTPGTKYNYRVGNGEDWSPIGSFTTDTAGNQDFRFITGSDSQASSLTGFEPWGDTFRKARDFMGDPKFLINAGDLVDNGDLETHWQWMLSTAEDSLMNVPFVPVLGGHEVNDYDGDVTTDNTNFYNHFNVPKQVVEGTHEGSVYSFEYGDALFMVFNSQFEGGLADNGKDIAWEDPEFRAQVDWMRNTVAKSDKKWKFVTFHKSPYAAGDNSAMWEDERVQFYRKHLIPVFDEMGIDMVFEAHDHMYMRSFQMLNNEVIPFESLDRDENGNYINPKGTVYLMSNAFGNKFYTKKNQYEYDENWNAIEKKDENGNPIPYDDFFAAINDQPFKKMFTDVSITDQILSFVSYTAAVEDEGKEGTVGNGLKDYDDYGIKRTDGTPEKVENLSVKLDGNNAVLSWKAPANSKEPVRGFRIYEKNDKVSTHWSDYVSTKEGQTEYTLTVKNINPSKKYEFVVKAVGTRINSEGVEVTTIDGDVNNEPPAAPEALEGKAVSPFQVNLKWKASSGSVEVTGYNVYRNGVKIGSTSADKTTFVDTGLDADTEYTYLVKAYNPEKIESLASNEITVQTKKAVAGEGPQKVFPQHVAYAEGSIKPNHISQQEMDATVIKMYKEWKEKYLTEDPSDKNLKYVWYSDGDPEWYPDGEVTVSEAHGYGMMIVAMMAGHDPLAQEDFDSLYRYFRAHPSEINSNLMAWQQGLVDGKVVDINGADSATDGDMDIAYSLLLADQQWGSNGEINYLAEAKKVINAIMDSEVLKGDWTLRIADWATSGKYVGATRPSDWMLQHMKDFRVVTGDSRWDNVIDATYELINDMYTNHSPNTGLLPDFIVKNGKEFVPAPPGFLEGPEDGDYYYNSARTPWRIGTDYLVTGDKRAKEQLSTLNKFFREVSNDTPSKVKAGYKLDGSKFLGDWEDITFTAPLMVSAMIDSSNQEWLNKLWDYNLETSTEDEVYFGNNIRMLSLIVVSGNWWTPTIVDSEAPTAPVIDKANAISDTEVELSWIPSEDNFVVAGYKVFRNDEEIATITDTTFKDTGLTPDTSYSYFVVAFDAAGNFSKTSNLRIVTTLPEVKNPPSMPTVSQVSDKDTTVTGTAEAGSTVKVKTSKEEIGSAKADDKSGKFTVKLKAAQKAGTVLYVTATKDGTESEARKVTVVDKTAPSTPTALQVSDKDTKVTGKAEASSTVTVKAGTKVLGSATAKSNGDYSVTIKAQKAGTVLSITAKDKAGNVSAAKKITVIDKTAPKTPTVSKVSDKDKKVTGKAEASSTVTVKAGTKVLGSAKAKTNGDYSVTIKTQKAGTVLSITAKDKAGNVSAVKKITVSDKTPPKAPTASKVSDKDKKVTGKAEAGSKVTVKAGKKVLGSATANKSGKYTVKLKSAQKAGKVLTITAKDKAGNVSAARKITVVDKTPPAAPKVNKVTIKSTKVTGKAEAGSSVYVKVGSKVIASGKASKNGNFSVKIKKQRAGAVLQVTARDKAKNVSKITKVTVKKK